MDNNKLNQLINEHLTDIKSKAGDKVYEVCRKIIDCPNMLISLDINDIDSTIRNCDLVEAIAFDCLGKEVSEMAKSALANLASKVAFVPQNLMLFLEQHNGYQIAIRDVASFQEALNTMPSKINVQLGVGNNPNGKGQVGLYFIMGYKKVEGVSQTDAGND